MCISIDHKKEILKIPKYNFTLIKNLSCSKD